MPNRNVNVVNQHTHVPDPSLSEAKSRAAQLRQRAATSNDAPRRIILETQTNLSAAAVAMMPKCRSLQRTVERKRKLAGEPIAAPQTVVDIDILQRLRESSRGEKFLLHDSGADDPNRFFIFGTDDNIRLLQENRHWFADGIFKVSPHLFYQVHTIHVLCQGCVVPVVYVLMQNKTQQSYIRVLQQIRQLDVTMQPSSVMCDFEKSFQNAVSLVFGDDVQIVGCLFHLSQCVWRKIQNLGLTEAYIEREDIRQSCKMLVALAFDSCLLMTLYAHLKNCKTSFLKKLMHCWITLKIRG